MINIEKKSNYREIFKRIKNKNRRTPDKATKFELQRNAPKERIQQLENRVNSAEAERDQFNWKQKPYEQTESCIIQ